MNPLDEIIDSLLAELELERTLGTRSIEFDRELLKEQAAPALASAPAQARVAAPRELAPARRPDTVQAAVEAPASEAGEANAGGIFDFVFLNDRALSPKATEMMAKIVVALGKNAETAPIVFTEPVPKAKVYIILGGRALKKWLPQTQAVAGAWVEFNGIETLVSFSPEYILRFSPDSPDLAKTKKTMWLGLKAAAARAKAGRKDS